MSNFDLCRDIQTVLKIDELSSPTLMYRINGFAKAMNMDLSNGKYLDIVNRSHYNFARNNNDDDTYNISISKVKSDDGKYDNILKIYGSYNGFNFHYTDVYNKSINKDRILEIPFSIEISTGDNVYNFKISSVDRERVQFTLNGIIEEEDSKVESGIRQFSYYANIADFSMILESVYSFVSNPREYFKKIYQIMTKKKIVFTNADVRNAMVIAGEASFDKPASGIVKKK